MATKPKSKSRDKPLSELMKNFCREYVKDFNGTQAVIRAGYKARGKSAEVQASRLISNVKVKQEIERLKAKVVVKQEISVQDILSNLIEIVDIGTGKKTVRKRIYDYDDNGERIAVDLDSTEINLPAANKATELLGKYLDMFTDKLKLEADVNAKVQHEGIDLSKLSSDELQVMLKLMDKAKEGEDDEN